MNISRNAFGAIVGIFVARLLLKLSLCETQGQSLRTVSSQPMQITSQPLDASSIPTWGNFYLLSQSGQAMPPLPFNPYSALGLNVYALWSNSFLVDDSSLDNASRAMSAGRMSTMDSSSGSDTTFVAPTYGSNDLWLEITNVANELAYLDLRNATNEVYAIWGATNLLTGWNVEAEVWPTNAAVMPFTVPTLDRQNLFVGAEDWTGVTENGNTTPDWWFWEYFGTVALSDTNLDSQGNTLLYDYTNGIDPNQIVFTVAVTNQFVNTSLPPVQIAVSQGVPFYFAVLVDSTNFPGATWTPYASSNITVSLGTTQGWHEVWVGLRGRMTMR